MRLQTLCLLFVEVLHMSESIAVNFLQKEPLYVALGQTLVLEVRFQVNAQERIQIRTWELKNSKGEVRVAEGDVTYNNRTTIENSGTLLRIRRVVESDYGIYKVTVTSNYGDQESDSRQVLKITTPPIATLSLLCSVQAVGSRWDTPNFSWKVDGAVANNDTGEISDDGSRLGVVSLAHNYTCIARSSQGESEVEVFRRTAPAPPAPPAPSDVCRCTWWIVVVVIETFALVVLIIGGYLHKKKNARRSAERTPESNHLNM